MMILMTILMIIMLILMIIMTVTVVVEGNDDEISVCLGLVV